MDAEETRLEDRKIEQLAYGLPGLKVEFGCGTRFLQGFHGIDMIDENELSEKYRDRYMKGDITDPSDPALCSIKGKVDFAIARHVCAALLPKLVIPFLQNVRACLSDGGYFLLNDIDFEGFINLYHTKNFEDAFGGNFKYWARWVAKYKGIKDWPEAAKDNSFWLNIAVRGSSRGDVVNWVYTKTQMKSLLRHVGFRSLEVLDVNDPRCNAFAHSRPEEADFVILSRK